MSEQKMGRLQYFGLKNGQTIAVLTEEPWRMDGQFLTITTTSGEEVSIVESEIAYIRDKETPIPTEEETQEMFRKALGIPRADVATSPEESPYL